MAYGFQNTCDTDEYFYLDNVPGYVSVNEFFYIETLEGEDFCGKYVNIPEVDYQILTYTLLGMTAQTNASACQQINPCPTVLINFPTNPGVSTNVNECLCLTEYPLGVGCVVPNVTPQTPNVTVNLKISGGTAPYTIYSANTSNQLGTVSVNGGTSQINTTRPSGTYCFDVYDFYQTKVSHCCTVGTASTLLSASYIKTNTNQCYNSGSVTVNINGGTPPYTVYRNGVSQGETTQFTGLGTTSTNTFYVTDSSTPMQQTSLSSQNITVTTITYPAQICMSFILCGQQFNLSFSKSQTANCPPAYICSNPEDVGSNGFFLTGDTTTNSWGTTQIEVNSSQMNLPDNCDLSSSTGRFVKTSASQQAAGIYTGEGPFAQATNINVTNGACLIIPTFTYQVDGTCSGLLGGAITISPNVSQFVATLDNISRPQNQTVFNNLGEGNHTLFITSNDVQSLTQTINVPSFANETSTQTNCEVRILSTQLQSSYTLSSTRQFLDIPVGVTVTTDVRRRYLITNAFFVQSDLGNYDFNVISTKIYKNGNLIHDITDSIGDRIEGSFGPVSIGNCPVRYDRLDDYFPTPNYTINIQNNDSFTFVDEITISRSSTELITANCDEFLKVTTFKIFNNVSDDSTSCFTFNTLAGSVTQNCKLNHNCQTNTNTFVYLDTYPIECPSA